MRRWNGWGDDALQYPVPGAAAALIAEQVGPGRPPRDIEFADVLGCVPESRLPPHPLISVEPKDRALHARGQSMPDLIALRTGHGLVFPDGVSYPASEEDVRELLRYAREAGIHVIPYGGGTSVVGHVNVRSTTTPTLTVDLARMSRLHFLDQTSQLATCGAGISGAVLEALLQAHGYTLGHFPQSFEYSTLGGWIATRSKGQQSLYYGGIEKLFAGGQVETPLGRLELPALVSSSAGPDLREIVLGSEGRLGIITQATMRVSPLPMVETFQAVFFPDWAEGVAAVRDMAQARLPLSMVRLSDPIETQVNLVLAGNPKTTGSLEWILKRRGMGDGKCMLILGITGSTGVQATLADALAVSRHHHSVQMAGGMIGRMWRRSRFRNPYLRNTLWEKGYAVETVETATDWARLMATRDKIESSLKTGLESMGERVLGFTHLSHVYPTGSSLYTTYIYRIAPDPAETLQRSQELLAASRGAIVAMGAAISHQHGVGMDHLPYLIHEKSELGLQGLRALCAAFDPCGMMNPGKLVE